MSIILKINAKFGAVN